MTEVTGAAPLGWYTGRDSPQTRRLRRRARRVPLRLRLLRRRPAVLDAGRRQADHLVVPYTLDTNDMRFAIAERFRHRRRVLHLPARRVRRAVRRRRRQARRRCCRSGCTAAWSGRPARIAALERFLDHVQAHDDVWIARRVDIARHWIEHFPPG